MTSELIKALSRLAGNRHSDGVSSIVSMEDRTIIIDGVHDLMVYTRAVPDVPELVRYDLSPFANGIVEEGDGEYVRYDQAVKVIAAKDAEIAVKDAEHLSLSNALNFSDKLASQRLERAKAAEAELAKIKQQKPVAWQCEYLEGDAPKSITTFVQSSMEKLRLEGCEITPLYTAPVSEAELKAAAIMAEEYISKYSHDYDGRSPHPQIVIEKLRVALEKSKS